MTPYAQALDQLSHMVPELATKPGQPRRKFSLDEVRVLLRALGNPERRYRTVLIAGTNGKGSTAATLDSILRAAGHRTGLYTSPHLVRPNERIRIAGQEIADDRFAAAFFRAHQMASRMVEQGRLAQMPSFFELLTVMAFLAFAEARVKIAVLEVGMGGRLDATNVADPTLSIITDIALDHTEWLGSTLTAIAGEKAGILRPQGTLICLHQNSAVDQVLCQTADGLGARVVDASRYLPGSAGCESYQIEALGETVLVEPPLSGPHQRRNLALAIAAAVELSSVSGAQLTPLQLANGIRATQWPGRFERLSACGAEWILDVAHNPAGAAALVSALDGLYAQLPDQKPRVLVFSCLRDKALDEMAATLFPRFELVVLVPIASPRAASLDSLTAAAAATAVAVCVAETVATALERAAAHSGGRPVVVSGSVYLVGEVRPLLTSGDNKG